MRKQIVAQSRCCSGGCLGCKILRGEGAGQADHSKEHQKASHKRHIARIPPPYSNVDHTCHHQRHKQLKAGLKHLKKRPQDAFCPVRLHITEQSFHCRFSLFLSNFFHSPLHSRTKNQFSSAPIKRMHIQKYSHKRRITMAARLPYIYEYPRPPIRLK